VLGGRVAMAGAVLLDVGAHGGDVAPEREGHDDPWWMGEARGEEKAWAVERGALGTGARAQERRPAAQTQPTEREHGGWTVRYSDAWAIRSIGCLAGPCHCGEQLAELGPRSHYPDRLKPDPVTAGERFGNRVRGQEAVESAVVLPGGDQSDAPWPRRREKVRAQWSRDEGLCVAQSGNLVRGQAGAEQMEGRRRLDVGEMN